MRNNDNRLVFLRFCLPTFMINGRARRRSTKMKPKLITRMNSILCLRPHFFGGFPFCAFFRYLTNFRRTYRRSMRNSSRIPNVRRRSFISFTCRCGSNNKGKEMRLVTTIKALLRSKNLILRNNTARKTRTTILIPVRCLRNLSYEAMLIQQSMIMQYTRTCRSPFVNFNRRLFRDGYACLLTIK